MNIKARYTAIINWFQENMPVAETELRYQDPYQLMVAVMLSAQCTDKRVNLLTPVFFEHYPTLASLSVASQDEVFEIIRSCSYPNSKATHLIAAAKKVVQDFGGQLPEDIDALMTLPGIGRKTANVIGSVAFNKQALAVDTHVHRVSARLGLTTGAKTPLETEKQLTSHIKPELYSIAHHWLILHGRYVCVARKPKCEACGLSSHCSFFLKNEQKKG
ncbi:MAG: endonuclease III [Bacteroidetes bacterium GWF2_49_14]|nr:MAG: endonuclease III [Bacteroidetes bacterium GWF2_49_14]HBB92442.1 endonuclease III [Bacteroidales bacterium]